MARAQPDLEDDKPGVFLETTEGEDVALERVRARRWVGDDGSRWRFALPTQIAVVMKHPPTEGGRTFETRPPRSGTWELEMQDDSRLSMVGAITVSLGGLTAEGSLIAMLITALAAGPQPSSDYHRTLRNEGYAALAGVGVASIGGVIWAIGNAQFRKGKPHLGEGTFRGLTPPRPPLGVAF
jgi:hypothetical protein